MPIQYNVVNYALQTGGQKYVARVRPVSSFSQEQVIDRVAAKGTTVGHADIKAVLQAFFEVCETLVTDGHWVHAGGLVVLHPRIKGSFEGIGDHFDPSRHEIDVGAKVSRRLRDSVKEQASTAKVPMKATGPSIGSYVDTGSGTTDDRLTPGNIGTITGWRLKFDTQQGDEGIFLTHRENNQVWHITTTSENRPRKLVFRVPDDLSEGSYQLEVRRRHRDSQKLRSALFDPRLQVGAT